MSDSLGDERKSVLIGEGNTQSERPSVTVGGWCHTRQTSDEGCEKRAFAIGVFSCGCKFGDSRVRSPLFAEIGGNRVQIQERIFSFSEGGGGRERHWLGERRIVA